MPVVHNVKKSDSSIQLFAPLLLSLNQIPYTQQATLIIRHPDDGKLYVNFDQEILQLIREAKILDRMGIEIPESAKIALFQVGTTATYLSPIGGPRMDAIRKPRYERAF